jgi:hypothetical protein
MTAVRKQPEQRARPRRRLPVIHGGGAAAGEGSRVSCENLSFRDRALALLDDAFGRPRVIPVDEGLAFYRWILQRPRGMSIYLTLDSPERPDIAHLLVSDPKQVLEPVASITMRTEEEVRIAIELIRKQWKG